MLEQPRLARDPQLLADTLKTRLYELMMLARQNAVLTDDEKARLLFETTADALSGLALAYEHFGRLPSRA